jgi:hypothetical protein
VTSPANGVPRRRPPLLVAVGRRFPLARSGTPRSTRHAPVHYWHDPVSGKVFCLSEAPSKKAALAVHRQAHGNLPDDIFEVLEGE